MASSSDRYSASGSERWRADTADLAHLLPTWLSPRAPTSTDERTTKRRDEGPTKLQKAFQADSSVVERRVYTAMAAGSIPVPPTRRRAAQVTLAARFRVASGSSVIRRHMKRRLRRVADNAGREGHGADTHHSRTLLRFRTGTAPRDTRALGTRNHTRSSMACRRRLRSPLRRDVADRRSTAAHYTRAVSRASSRPSALRSPSCRCDKLQPPRGERSRERRLWSRSKTLSSRLRAPNHAKKGSAKDVRGPSGGAPSHPRFSSQCGGGTEGPVRVTAG